MPKSILQSVKPIWASKIYSGEKWLELRKSYPKCTLPTVVYIYESGKGLVTGMYILQGVLHTTKPESFTKPGCISLEELTTYGPDGRGVYHGWVIEDPVKFTVPYPLSAFGIKRPPQSWRYTDGPVEIKSEDIRYALDRRCEK